MRPLLLAGSPARRVYVATPGGSAHRGHAIAAPPDNNIVATSQGPLCRSTPSRSTASRVLHRLKLTSLMIVMSPPTDLDLAKLTFPF